MAAGHNFRNAFYGFNREDVVKYIEFITSKHNAMVNQLNSEKQALADEIMQLRNHDELNTKIAQLEEANAQWAEKYADLEKQMAAEKAAADAELEAKLAEVTAQRDEAIAAQNSAKTIADEELEAYRRAERAERVAKERADLIYQQATGTLAQATTQVDEAAASFCSIAEQVSAQLAQMQQAVEGSKQALADATATMYAIRPEEAAEEAPAEAAVEEAAAE